MRQGGAAILAVLVLTAGCTGTHRHALAPGAVAFDYPAERRGALLLPRGTPYILCAEPSPDVALQRTIDMAATYQIPANADVKASLDYSTAVVQLAGRTQTTRFLEAAMYRLCEQAANGNLTPADVKELYGKVLDAALALSRAAAANEAANAAAMSTDPETKRRILNYFMVPEPAPPSSTSTDDLIPRIIITP